MVLRFLIRYFANNEQLVQRISESYIMRRAAQLVVSYMYKSKSIAEGRGFKMDLTPERFREFIRMFRENIKKEIESAKEELRKRK